MLNQRQKTVFACRTSVMWMSYYSQYTQAETAVWQGGQWQPWQAAIRVANSGKVAGVGCSHSVAHWPGAAATPAASYFCLHNVSTKITPQKYSCPISRISCRYFFTFIYCSVTFFSKTQGQDSCVSSSLSVMAS